MFRTPTSSVMITRMFGFLPDVCATAVVAADSASTAPAISATSAKCPSNNRLMGCFLWIARRDFLGGAMDPHPGRGTIWRLRRGKCRGLSTLVS